MKVRLRTTDGKSFITDLSHDQLSSHGVIEVEHKCFAYRGFINRGAAEYQETGRLAIAWSRFTQEQPPPVFGVGVAVKLIAVHRAEDKKYIGQFATIIDGSGIITDWRIKFGDGQSIGVLTSEIVLCPPTT